MVGRKDWQHTWRRDASNLVTQHVTVNYSTFHTPIMVKRKGRNSDPKSEDAVEFQPEADSDHSDYEQSKPTKRRRTSTVTRRASKRPVLDSEDTPPPSGHTEVPHSKALHVVISSHDTLVALLSWFTGVSNNRMMPWRKTYDPSLNAAGRSHRAYEVNPACYNLMGLHLTQLWLYSRSGYPKLCCSRRV